MMGGLVPQSGARQEMSGNVPLAVPLGNLRVWESLRKGAFPQAWASISFHHKVSLPSSELMHDLATVLTDSANRTLKDSLSLPHSFSFYLCSTLYPPNTHRPSLDLSILHQSSPLPFLCIGPNVSELSKERHSLIFLSLTFLHLFIHEIFYHVLSPIWSKFSRYVFVSALTCV